MATMPLEWLLGQSVPLMFALRDNEANRTNESKKRTSNGSDSTESTPAEAPAAEFRGSLYLNLCYREECGFECASDAAQDESHWFDEDDDEVEGGLPPHFQRLRHRRSMHTNKTGNATGQNTGTTQPIHATGSNVSGKKPFSPPKSITLYRPRNPWPDGTLQILWQKKERNAFGIKGLDKFKAFMDLNLDDLSTIEIDSNHRELGATIELHPDETTVKRIGSITCYSIRPPALKELSSLEQPQDRTDDGDRDLPFPLRQLLEQLSKQPSQIFQSWRRNEGKGKKKKGNIGTEGTEDTVQELYWKHHWHPSTPVSSYLWIEDVSIDEKYRGIGLGLCLLEDAFRRVADVASWILASPPPPPSKSSKEKPLLQEYFELMGFSALAALTSSASSPKTSSSPGEIPMTRKKRGHENDDNNKTEEEPSTFFLARWNASPVNPRLDEVLPSVPFTAQQSKDQGFHL